MFAAALLLALFSAPALADSQSGLDRAVAAHQEGQFELARDALLALLEDPTLSAAGQAKARAYLASSYLALKDPDRASLLLKGMLRAAPDTVLDPNLFPPELIVLEQRARLELDREKAPLPVYPARRLAWLPAVVTLAAGAAGAYFAVETADRYAQLTGPISLGHISSSQETTLTNDGRTFQIIAATMFAVAVVALATTGILFFWHAAQHTSTGAPPAGSTR